MGIRKINYFSSHSSIRQSTASSTSNTSHSNLTLKNPRFELQQNEATEKFSFSVFFGIVQRNSKFLLFVTHEMNVNLKFIISDQRANK